MTEQEIMTYKLSKMKHYCPNGLEYFCDGRPNKSYNDQNTEYKPCPRRFACALKEQERMFKPLDKMVELTLKIIVDVDDNEEIIGIKENIAAQLEDVPGVHAVGVVNVKPVKGG